MTAVMKENPNITRFMKEQRFSKREAEPEAKREGARPLKKYSTVTGLVRVSHVQRAPLSLSLSASPAGTCFCARRPKVERGLGGARAERERHWRLPAVPSGAPLVSSLQSLGLLR